MEPPFDIRKPIASGTHDQQIRVVTDRGGKTHIRPEYYGQDSLLIFDHLTRRIALLHAGSAVDRARLREQVIQLLRGPLPPTGASPWHARAVSIVWIGCHQMAGWFAEHRSIPVSPSILPGINSRSRS